jgi:hypothetical protein
MQFLREELPSLHTFSEIQQIENTKQEKTTYEGKETENPTQKKGKLPEKRNPRSRSM